MRLHTFPDAFVIVPARQLSDGAEADKDVPDDLQGPALRIDRETFAITRLTAAQHAQLDLAAAQSTFIYGIMGILHLLRGPYLLVITNSSKTTSVLGHTIRRVTDVTVLPFSAAKLAHDLSDKSQRADEREYLDRLHRVLEASEFYFSYDFDITHTMQRQWAAPVPGDDPAAAWQAADARFFWNRFMSQTLIDAGMHEWVLPLMSGYVFSEQRAIAGRPVTLVLISRRSCKRVGKRFTSRGLDSRGNASNFAETEQVILVPEGEHVHLFSYVQTRGSIPLVWRQSVTLKYMPTPELIDGEAQVDQAFSKHFAEQVALYGRQILINLVNQKGKELILQRALERQVSGANNPELRLISFDFHKECKKMQYQNISKLVAQVENEFGGMGYFHAVLPSMSYSPHRVAPGSRARVVREQKAVFRTNCMDCLDRTNVVQSVFGRLAIARSLADAGLFTMPAKLDNELEPFTKNSPEFERVYKATWANNADAMSMQYSGTGALKTDYTRTGKRTAMGAMQDLKNSLKRYYLNNFSDGKFHDGLDLLIGNYVPSTKRKSPFAEHRNAKNKPSLFRYVGRIAMIVAVVFLVWAFFGPFFGLPTPSTNILLLLYIVAFPVVGFKLAERRGRDFVDKPRLGSDPGAPGTKLKIA